MNRAVLGLLAVLALTACSPVKRDEVIGSYVLDNKAAKFSLELKADGTYVHTCIQTDGQSSQRTGRWEWDEKDTDNPLCLDNFREFPSEDLGEIADSQVIFILHPERSAQGIRFPIGDAEAPTHYFVRQDSALH